MARIPESRPPGQWRGRLAQISSLVRQYLPRHWVLRTLLLVNSLAAVALALSFQAASSDLRIVSQRVYWDPLSHTQGTMIYFCVGDLTAFVTDDHANLSLSNGDAECPPEARSTAIVTSDNPGVFRIALVLIAFSSALQVLMVRKET